MAGGQTAGLFISFEGIDGSGKSTQARRLAEHLRAKGRTVRLTREPGGSEGGEQIRRLLLDGPSERWSPESELLLFTAARRDHLERVIWPALERGEVVICDRFADSTRVFQGMARSDLGPLVDRLHALMIAAEPDVTLLLDAAPAEGLRRAHARAGGELRFEGMGLAFQERVRAGFLDLAARHPARFRVIDGAHSETRVAADILAALEGRC